VFPLNDAKFLIRLAFLIGFYVFDGGNFGGFRQEFLRCPMVEGFVINKRWRVRCGFCSGHLDKKAKKGEKKGRKTRV